MVIETLSKDSTIEEISKHLEEKYANSAPCLNQIYKVAITVGYNTQTSVECMFSALNRIDIPHRRCQLSWREGSLTLLHFESKLARNVTFKAKEWRKKPRKLMI